MAKVQRDTIPMPLGKSRVVDVMKDYAVINVQFEASESEFDLVIDGSVDSDFFVNVDVTDSGTFTFRIGEFQNLEPGQRGFIAVWNKSGSNCDFEIAKYPLDQPKGYWAMNANTLLMLEYFVLEENAPVLSVFGSWEFPSGGD